MKQLLLLLCCLTGVLPAQGLHITVPDANCHLFESRFDNPFSDTKGYYQPAILWHAEYAVASYASAALLDNYLIPAVSGGRHLPPWLNASIAWGATGPFWHIRGGLIKRSYPINPMDWAYDAVNRGTPYVWAAGLPADSNDHRNFFSRHWKPTAMWLVADLSLACWASP